MAIRFVFGSQGGGRPQEVNLAGQQGILFSTTPRFKYQGHKIHGIKLWSYDIHNYNQTLNDRNILQLTAEEANIKFETNRLGEEILEIDNANLVGFPIPHFSFELSSNHAFPITSNYTFTYLEVDIKPQKLDPTAEGTQITKVRLAFDQEDRLDEFKRGWMDEIYKGVKKFKIQGFDQFSDVSTGGKFWTSEILTIENAGQIISNPAETTESPQPDTNIPENTTPPPPPPETIQKIDLEFKIVDLRENHGGHFALTLENPRNLTEQAGNPRYRFVVIRPKNDADKNNLKVNNKIKIKEIEISSKKTQVRSECLDVLGFYKSIDLVEAAQTTPNQNNTPPWISAFDIIFEATLNDNQIRNFLTTAGISSEEFMNRLMDWGYEETLINRPANTLKYDEIKKFLKIDTQTPPNNPPTNDNPPPNTPPNTPKPNTPKPTQNPTPTQENSQKSEENIKDINNSSSVEQARTKTQTEINSLLERYGVKAEQLSTSLWENETTWETYLNKLSTVDQVSQFIKRMKVAIMQQDKQNQKANQQLSVTQLKTNIKQNIKNLLKKYPSVKTDSNSILEDWEVALERESDKTKLTNLERQFREAIIASANQKQTTNDSPKSNLATKLLIGGSIILVIAGAAFSLVIIRNKRVKKSKKIS